MPKASVPQISRPEPDASARPGVQGALWPRERLLLSWARLMGWATLAEGDLLRDPAYRRLWTSILTSAFGAQITMLALPLTAAVLLQASPTQMGLLTAMEIAPFALFSLPGGVWLDRVRKLPVYVVGETMIGLILASVPLAWWMGWLAMPWMYTVGFVIGTIHTVAGSAAQIVLTQVVPRERLVEAHAKNAMATSGAEVAGPGLAGALIKLLGAPAALLVDAALLVASAWILRGIPIQEDPPQPVPTSTPQAFWNDLMEGLRFVGGHPLLVTLAVTVGLWQMAHYAAVVVQILFATRVLGMGEQSIGLSYIALGVGTVIASVVGRRISARIGPGPCMLLGFAITGAGWLILALAPEGLLGVALFAAMLMSFSAGAIFIFINFLALRQAVTPAPLLGRMTSTMRWLTLLAAGPGALLGGWLGEHLSLRWALAFAGATSLLLAVLAWRVPRLRHLKTLPKPDEQQAAASDAPGVAGRPEGSAQGRTPEPHR
jgi:MFS family permease